MSLHDLKNLLLSQLPVIGPHSDIEGQLLLNGTKPMGWIDLLPPTADPGFGSNRKKLELQKQLDQAVEDGRLKSADVVVRLRGADGKPGAGPPCTFRHYCQPGNESDMEKMVVFNQKAFSGEQPDANLEKSFGDYLGYRKRDQMLFAAVMKYGRHLPRTLMDAVYSLNEKVTQPAYQAEALKKKAQAPGPKA